MEREKKPSNLKNNIAESSLGFLFYFFLFSVHFWLSTREASNPEMPTDVGKRSQNKFLVSVAIKTGKEQASKTENFLIISLLQQNTIENYDIYPSHQAVTRHHANHCEVYQRRLNGIKILIHSRMLRGHPLSKRQCRPCGSSNKTLLPLSARELSLEI